MKWISVKKRLPKISDTYQVKVKYMDKSGSLITTDEFNASHIACKYGWQKYNVTHWQPLPKPPKSK